LIILCQSLPVALMIRRTWRWRIVAATCPEARVVLRS
jgi:hypothetical protein